MGAVRIRKLTPVIQRPQESHRDWGLVDDDRTEELRTRKAPAATEARREPTQDPIEKRSSWRAQPHLPTTGSLTRNRRHGPLNSVLSYGAGPFRFGDDRRPARRRLDPLHTR
jgi:hypothetical protein